eukprot:8742-Heterococcus_DN1.PRE.1
MNTTMKGIESLFVVETLKHVGIPPLAWYWTSLPNVTILLSLYVAAFALDWLLKKTCRTYAVKLSSMYLYFEALVLDLNRMHVITMVESTDVEPQ